MLPRPSLCPNVPDLTNSDFPDLTDSEPSIVLPENSSGSTRDQPSNARPEAPTIVRVFQAVRGRFGACVARSGKNSFSEYRTPTKRRLAAAMNLVIRFSTQCLFSNLSQAMRSVEATKKRSPAQHPKESLHLRHGCCPQ